MIVKRHLVILLVLTVLIRGVMFISYPMGGQDEQQGYHRYVVSKVLAGELQIGNLRYGPGYPLFIAPVSALGDRFGRFDDRIELLFQVALSSLIPFLLYDILRSRHSPRAAFVVAILSLIDPFSLQWAHFYTAVWLVALCLVLALWLLHHAERRRSWRLVVVAGLVTGFGVLGRWNYAPVAVGLGCLLLFVEPDGFRHRLRQIMLFSVSAIVLVLLVHVTVQVPATGVWNFSCISAISMIEATRSAGLTLHVDHGPNSKRLLHLIGLGQTSQLESPTAVKAAWYSDVFPLWQTPGTWLTDAERDAFLNQNEPENLLTETQGDINALTSPLLFYIGPCELDQLLRTVFFETVFAEPLPWLLSIPANAWRLLQPPIMMGEFPDYTLPPARSLTYEDDGGRLGFQQAFGRWDHYTGQWVWWPGIELFTSLWGPLNALRFLAFPALVWALFTRRRFYSAIAFLLLLYISVLAAIDYPEPRIYAIVYPLGPLLVGGLLVTLWERLRRLMGH